MRISLFVFFVMFSCTGRKLTVADLKFPDPEKNGILKSDIKEMLGVPSMQIASVDTTFRNTYDKVGRAIRTSPYLGETKTYWYDSMNLPDSLYEQEWDVSASYKIIPTFEADESALYLYYFDPHYKADRYVEKLMFDGNGRLTQLDRHYLRHTAFKNVPAYKALINKPEYTARYFYDDKSRLLKDSVDSDYVIVHHYYYSDRLDSMRYTRSDRARFYEEQTTYYDAEELRKSTKVAVTDRHFGGGRETSASRYAYTIAWYYKRW